jgi:hypothetical protein
MNANGNLATAVLGAIAGLLLGGVLAKGAADAAQLLGAWGVVGAMLGGGIGALRREPLTRASAIGGALGVMFAIVILVLDALGLGA